MKTTMLLCVALAAAAFSPTARADEWNKKTYFTFSQPVEIPGVVLQPGEYVFKLMDTMADRNVVQIFNKDETHLYATVLAIPDYRMEPAGKTVISFEERASGSPEAVKAWFYPGDNYGQEFVYPRVKAMELAKANKQPVPSMPNETVANISKPAKSSNEPSVMAMKKAPIKAEQPNGQETEVAQAIQTKPPAAAKPQQPVETAAAHPPKRLPRTASQMPLIGLLGLMAAAAALVVRGTSRRVA